MKCQITIEIKKIKCQVTIEIKNGGYDYKRDKHIIEKISELLKWDILTVNVDPKFCFNRNIKAKNGRVVGKIKFFKEKQKRKTAVLSCNYCGHKQKPKCQECGNWPLPAQKR